MRLKELYKKEITKKLQEKFGYKNIWQTPRITKVVINVGVGRHSKDKNYIENVVNNITAISGLRFWMQTLFKRSKKPAFSTGIPQSHSGKTSWERGERKIR